MSLAYNSNGDPTPESLQADIARANLHRMRGDYKGAIDQCLSVLKRAPEDHDAHILIGDIYAEQGDLGQATQWYELALDLHPKDDATKSKLAAVKERQRQRDAASAAEQIGLPSDKPSYGLYAGVLCVVFAAVAIGAFLLGQRQEATRPEMRTIAAVAPETGATGTEPGLTTPESPAALSLPDQDRQLVATLQSRMPPGTTVISALEDPRDRSLVATVGIRAEDSDRTVTAEVGRIALTNLPTAPRISVRVVKNGKLTYVGTVERDRMLIAETPEWRNANPSAEAYLIQMLTHEWPPAPDAATGTSVPGGTDPGTAPIDPNTPTANPTTP